MVLDVKQYENPHSSANPGGDYKAAYRLFELSDSIPEFAPNYSGSMRKLHKLYGSILDSASTTNAFTRSILADSRSNFNSARLSGMGGIPNDWYLVSAIPGNWYDLVKQRSYLIPMTIKLDDEVSGTGGFILMDDDERVSWSINTGGKQEHKMADGTSIKEITVDVMVVEFQRSWFNFELFSSPGWEIQGLKPNYFSTGSLSQNGGTMPLVIKSMLVGANFAMTGQFADRDLNLLQQNSEEVSIGPFAISGAGKAATISGNSATVKIQSNVTQVIGFTSQLVPQAPAVNS